MNEALKLVEDEIELDEDGQEPIENFQRPPAVELSDEDRKTLKTDNEEDLELIEADKDGNRYLPGQEPPRNKPLEEAALKYKNLRDERIGLGREEKQAKDLLMGLMKRDDIPVYHFDGLEIKLTQTPNVKVIKEQKEEEEDVE